MRSPIRTVPLVNGVPMPGAVPDSPSTSEDGAVVARPPLRLTLKLPALLQRKASILGTAIAEPTFQEAKESRFRFILPVYSVLGRSTGYG